MAFRTIVLRQCRKARPMQENLLDNLSLLGRQQKAKGPVLRSVISCTWSINVK